MSEKTLRARRRRDPLSVFLRGYRLAGGHHHRGGVCGAGRLYTDKRRAQPLAGSLPAQVHFGQLLDAAGHFQHHLHDASVAGGGGAAGHLLGHLFDRVRKARKQAGQGGAPDHGDVAGHPLHRLRPVWIPVLPRAASVGLLAAGGRDDAGDHDLAADHAHHGGSRTLVPDGYREGSFASARAGCAPFSASCCPRPSPAFWRASSSPSAASSARRRRSFTPRHLRQTADSLFPRCARCRYTCMCFPARGCTSTRLTPRRRCC